MTLTTTLHFTKIARPSAAVRRGSLLIPALVSLCLLSPPVRAQSPEAPASPSDALPVRAVTLFSSGVSYTLREGEVSGDATVPLTFRTAQINDILKSLVLLDDAGTVQPVVYAAKDPIGRALQSFAVDVSQPTDRISLLNRLKGARVVVEAGGTVVAAATTTEKRTLTGQIVGVDRDDVRTGNGGYAGYSGAGYLLSVLGDDGLQSVPLGEVRTIRFLDERINREFKAALGLLSAGSDDKRRQVTLRFDGKGRRTVHVGYVSESPLWKISYRLLIGGAAAGTGAGKPEGPAFLQGWALVENTTDEDWTAIRLSLVSGRPISFLQDLYQPLYLPRPVVPPDVIASPFPQLVEAAIEGNLPASGSGGVGGGVGGGSFGGGGFGGLAGGDSFGRAPLRSSRDAPAAAEPASPLASPEDVARGVYAKGEMAYNNGSVAAQAAGRPAGELFAYNIATPVTLPRQQAAMIPVVAQSIEGEKISLYNADTDAHTPMNAFQIRNNTPLYLKGGPVTLFDGGTYAGDARMEDIPPGDSRLIAYAVDLAVLGERQPTRTTGFGTAIVIHGGVMTVSHKERSETTYTLKNKAEKPRRVIVEHPFDAAFHLVQPAKADSRTATHYRFVVPVAPGANASLTVATERPVAQVVALLQADTPALEVFFHRDGIPPRVTAILRDIIARRLKVQDLQKQVAATDEEIKSIDADQDRVRKNMEALDRQSALYKRYVEQLDAQENRIQTLRAEATRLRAAASAADRELRTFIDGLDLSAS